MYFRLFGEEESIRTFVRQGPKSRETPIYVVIDRSLRHILSYKAGRHLFRQKKPSTVRKEYRVGTEHYIAEGGHLYKMMGWPSQTAALAKNRFEQITAGCNDCDALQVGI